MTVESSDDTLNSSKEAGGSIVHPKEESPNMGYYALVKDSEDNVIGVWETIPRN